MSSYVTMTDYYIRRPDGKTWHLRKIAGQFVEVDLDAPIVWMDPEDPARRAVWIAAERLLHPWEEHLLLEGPKA